MKTTKTTVDELVRSSIREVQNSIELAKQLCINTQLDWHDQATLSWVYGLIINTLGQLLKEKRDELPINLNKKQNKIIIKGDGDDEPTVSDQ